MRRGITLVLALVCATCSGGSNDSHGPGPNDPVASPGPAAYAVSIGSSADTTCELLSDGQLFCWGSDRDGMLGDGGGESYFGTATPVRAGLATFVALSMGIRHACALASNGQLFCWGNNQFGQIDSTAFSYRSGPAVVISPDRFRAVATSRATDEGHTCAIRVDGALFCVGSNFAGQLGDGSQLQRVTLTRVGTDTDWASVAAGRAHTCAIKTDGTLSCWGSNTQGQLGDGGPSRSSPAPIGSEADWTRLAAGPDYTCGLRGSGALYCWGAPMGGTTPTRIGGVDLFGSIAAGVAHACAIRSDGTLWCWGANTAGQLGVGSRAPSTSPVQVGNATDWIAVAPGGSHTCAIRADRSRWCFGDNTYGQLGSGVLGRKHSPTRVGTATGWQVIAARGARTCALRAGALYCAGAAPVGDGTRASRDALVQLGTSAWSTVAVGTTHACAIRADGTLWCWGASDVGALGLGSSTAEAVAPAQVGAATTWTSIAAGERHTCAVRADGSLWCWGEDYGGQLGTRTGFDIVYDPTRVGTDTGWTLVSGGDRHTCALKTGGALYCWGDGRDGQVGDGSATYVTAPTRIGTASWSTVSCGRTHTCGVQANGSLWCWGRNSAGGLGMGPWTSHVTVPTLVNSETDWRTVSGGVDSTCALKTSGTLWCFGSSSFGALGLGPSTFGVDVPTQIGTTADWASLALAGDHVCATRTDGAAFCWGLNDAGQHGDGWAWEEVPVQVLPQR